MNILTTNITYYNWCFNNKQLVLIIYFIKNISGLISLQCLTDQLYIHMDLHKKFKKKYISYFSKNIMNQKLKF